MHALGLDQKQGDHFSPFTGQDVVGSACRSGVHGFYPDAVCDQILQPLRLGKPKFLSAAKQDELGPALGPWTEVTGAQVLELSCGPSSRGHIGHTAHGQGLCMSHAIDLDPGPVISVDGRGIGFVGLEFHGTAKMESSAIRGQALKTVHEGRAKCGQIIGFPSSTLPLEAL